MNDKPWKVEICDGPHLEQHLNEMHSRGQNVFAILSVGSKLERNKLDPRQQTLIPFLMVVGYQQVTVVGEN